MAGAGFKTFNTGDVLTASDVNTYLMQQTVMVFADSSARTTALGANVAEGMISYLKDTNAVEVYNGSAWVSSDDPNAIQNTIVDAKGDLISATAADTPARLAVGTDGQILTADSTTATGLKWANASSTPTFVGCEVRKSATQAATQSAYTTLTFDTETFDTDAFHSTVTNTSRITIPSGKGGYYLVYWNIGLSGDGAVAVSLDKNGSAYKRAAGFKTGGGTGYFANTEVMSLVATDYIEVAIYTASSGLDIESDAQNTKQTTFGVAFLGA